MKKGCFNSMLFNNKLERERGLSKSKAMDSLGRPIGNTSGSEDPALNDTDKNIHSWSNSGSYSCSNVDYFLGVEDVWNFISDDIFFVRDNNGNNYSVYFDMENQIFEIENDSSFLSELEIPFSSYLKSKSHSRYDDSDSDTQYSWKNHIQNCIDSYLCSEISSDSNTQYSWKNHIRSYIDSYLCSEIGSDCDSGSEGGENVNGSDSYSSNSFQKFNHLWVLCENCYISNYKKFLKSKMNICEYCGYHLKMNSSDRIELLIDPGTWIPMDEDMVSIDPIDFDSEDTEEAEDTGAWNPNPMDKDMVFIDPFDFDSEDTEEAEAEETEEWKAEETEESEVEDTEEAGVEETEDTEESKTKETELSVDPGTWKSMDEDMVSIDPIDFHSEDTEGAEEEDTEEAEEEEESYLDRLNSHQIKTGLNEAVQTGIGQINGIPVAMGLMDFEFIGGSMGSVVGEKITRLIEYATNRSLPLIMVCASGGARMQEGTLSLMQMAKISSALYNYQLNQKLFYVSILTTPTTGGVTASFGMLGDIVIAEPNAYIAFAGKRIIEQLLNVEVPEGVQEAEYSFYKGLLDSIVPRNPLKGVLNELFQLHGFFPSNQNSISIKNKI
uniref:acetyl-CoA carboxylase carboxyltransferase beta n=1 Tax=Cananga odorata TaxID=13393 RepID=UPI001EDD886D|nr:acetyl-CoA carboxylase carboxyltransferase beta [Cananga odorata]UKH49816.1 acetyl-CoA carboxylase carboxyltransferase beta [Cananga odorata]